MDEGLRKTLEANKREMFDGMRAYHESEIKHANHALTLLISITGAANAAVLALATKTDRGVSVRLGAVLLFGLVFVLATLIGFVTSKKIASDNSLYKRFGAEYHRTCKALGLFDPIGNIVEAVKENRPIGQGDGFRNTQRAVWVFAGLAWALTGAFVAVLLIE